MVPGLLYTDVAAVHGHVACVGGHCPTSITAGHIAEDACLDTEAEIYGRGIHHAIRLIVDTDGYSPHVRVVLMWSSTMTDLACNIVDVYIAPKGIKPLGNASYIYIYMCLCTKCKNVFPLRFRNNCLKTCTVWFDTNYHINNLVQDCSNSFANALALPESCTKPSNAIINAAHILLLSFVLVMYRLIPIISYRTTPLWAGQPSNPDCVINLHESINKWCKWCIDPLQKQIKRYECTWSLVDVRSLIFMYFDIVIYITKRSVRRTCFL